MPVHAAEYVREQRAYGLAGIAAMLLRGCDRDAKLNRSCRFARDMDTQIANEPAIRTQADCALHPTPLSFRCKRLLCSDEFLYCRDRGRPPALIAGDTGIRAILKQRCRVIAAQKIEVQTLRVHQHGKHCWMLQSLEPAHGRRSSPHLLNGCVERITLLPRCGRRMDGVRVRHQIVAFKCKYAHRADLELDPHKRDCGQQSGKRALAFTHLDNQQTVA